jgi:hypothetical protein
MFSITAIAIQRIDGYAIHIFKRIGNHDNKYVKVIKNGNEFGKYILVGNKKGWESELSLDKTKQVKITNWIEKHTDFILHKIEELGAIP